MKKGALFFAMITMFAFTSCKNNNASSKVKKANVQEAEKRDAKAEENANKFPEMTFAESSYDFGTITQGEEVTHTFKFTNTGDAPLVITDTQTTCGCTVPSYPKGKSIAPGEMGKIVVVFNSTGKIGTQHKTITVRANTKDRKEKITIQAIVKPKNKA